MAAPRPTSYQNLPKKILFLEAFINFNIRSGLSPSRLSTFALKVCLITMLNCIRRFLIKIKIAQSQLSFCYHLYVNRFRRKPAITKFDKSFTPNYNSSQNFATSTSSVLLRTNPFLEINQKEDFFYALIQLDHN